MTTSAPSAPPGRPPLSRAATARRTGLSLRGRTFVAVGLISVAAGLLLGVVDLERVGVLLLALPLPAWIAVRQSRSGLQITHSVHPARTSVGGRSEVHLALVNPNAFGTGPLRITETVPGSQPLRFSVSGIRGRQRRTVAYPLPTQRRGRFTVGPTDVTASDPFGLVTADSRSHNVAQLIVQPHRELLAPLPLPIAWRDGGTHSSHSVGSGGSDDASVREYRNGDDLRKIHWRSTARSGNLMVRQEERPWHGQSLVLLDTRTSAYPPPSADLAGDGIDDWATDAFEWAVSAAASIACHLVDRGRRVSLVNGSGRVAYDDSQAMLDLLADTRRANRADVQPLADALNNLGRDASVLAVLCSSDARSLSEFVVRPRLPGSAVVLLLKPWTFRKPAVDGEELRLLDEEWQTAADSLRAGGWRVVAAEAESKLPELWPLLLASTGGLRR